MIHKIYSDLPEFKNLQFRRGLNILLSETTEGATDKQTRNRAGKSSLVEIINFLMGADCPPQSIFRHSRLEQCYFGMLFHLAGQRVDVRRTGARPGMIALVDGSTEGWPKQPERSLDERTFSTKKWRINLASLMFGLSVPEGAEDEGVGTEESNDGQRRAKPVALTFRNLYSYFARRHSSGSFMEPFRHGAKQQIGDMQMAIMFLLGIDWTIARDWEQVRRRERIIKAIIGGGMPSPIPGFRGTTADLRSLLAVRESHISKLTATVDNLQVLDEYPELEQEASDMTIAIGGLSDENMMDRRLVADLRVAIDAEAPPTYNDLKQVYDEAGVVLPGISLRTFDEVVQFHEAVVANRRTYLKGEIEEAERRISERNVEIRERERRKAEILSILHAHGALDQLVRLNAERSRFQGEIEAIRTYMSQLEATEKEKTELVIERGQLLLRLQQDYHEQMDAISRAVLAFREISTDLYEDDAHGFLAVDGSENGPKFEVRIHGGRSKGISTMQIFCFDMTLMLLCCERGIGPGYLVHDSHIFDSADARQVAKALQIGAELSNRFGFQYIVTLNSDQIAEREWFSDNFNVEEYILSPRLTDKTKDGGLFGIRFA